jgi:hypothetical protein
MNRAQAIQISTTLRAMADSQALSVRMRSPSDSGYAEGKACAYREAADMIDEAVAAEDAR